MTMTLRKMTTTWRWKRDVTTWRLRLSDDDATTTMTWRRDDYDDVMTTRWLRWSDDDDYDQVMMTRQRRSDDDEVMTTWQSQHRPQILVNKAHGRIISKLNVTSINNWLWRTEWEWLKCEVWLQLLTTVQCRHVSECSGFS